MIKYERPTEDDADELAKLWLRLGKECGNLTNPNTEWWTERYILFIGTDSYVAVKATDKGKTVGFMDGFVMKEPSTGKIHGIGQFLYVEKDYRDTPVAGNIYKRMFKEARKKGATVFDLSERVGGNLWETKGFKPVTTILRKEYNA